MSNNQYTQKSMEAIQAAQALAGEYGNQELSQAHLLAALTESAEGLIAQLLTQMQKDANAVHSAAVAEIEKLPRVSGGGREAGKVYVALTDGGKQVEGIDGGQGAQLIVFGDQNSKRAVRYLKTISVE